MPSIEFLKNKDTQHNVVALSNHLRVFVLYACPICERYTIHAPRSDRKGYYFVDHKRVPVHQLDFDGSQKFVGLAAADSCFVENCESIINIDTTRTVIRVK